MNQKQSVQLVMEVTDITGSRDPGRDGGGPQGQPHRASRRRYTHFTFICKPPKKKLPSALLLQSYYKTKAELQKHSVQPGLELPLRRGEWGSTSSAVRTVPIHSG